MAFKNLPTGDKQLALECMKAIVDGPAIKDWEFHTRLGITRSTLRQMISMWPEIDDNSDDSEEFLAINNCFNEVCHGVYMTQIEWANWFTEPRDRIKQAYANWLRLRGATSSGIR